MNTELAAWLQRLNNVGKAQYAGRFEEAESEAKEAIREAEKLDIDGKHEEHFYLKEALSTLSEVYAHQKKYSVAAQTMERRLALDTPTSKVFDLGRLAKLYAHCDQTELAEQTLRRASDLAKTILDKYSSITAEYDEFEVCRFDIAESYFRQKQFDKAEKLLEQLTARRSFYDGWYDHVQGQYWELLADVYNSEGKRDKAESAYDKTLEYYSHADYLGRDNPCKTFFDKYVRFLESHGKAKKAAEMRTLMNRWTIEVEENMKPPVLLAPTAPVLPF